MSTGKVLQISAEDAKYIDPTQISSIQMVDGTTIVIKGSETEEGFVEETQQDEQQYQTQDAQGQQQPQNLRGRGVLGALAGVAAGTALLGTAAALGAGMRRPYGGYGMGPMMRPPMMGPPMMRGPMMGGPMMMRGPMRRGFY